ncbi:16S rRNA (cytidine1402-2'-O)-methyltransferase [Pontibacter ummariensis]|uniref:16S rRNA (Cytidine1402-2'-O)-methyltransferase n=1 Tax=Pontibacter ummariensis TaxID=1610492 RepID=A0A239KAV8_9BACT|nr:SAM-dependent methyltransferase [Pontibacter ummariensis]PRY06037.1 16S rRNA (cytidine1402-2'-O)-methyltransferase [Pontibacter ummariensis]SNT14234.1 16S rRNA (cytidine1402-2'-O)-methyltransferase [Pontibacter ummariensis]
MKKSGTLYLIPTVLAEDTADKVISPQVKETVQHLTYFIVENLRTARRYVKSICPELVIEQLTFVQIDKDATPAQVQASLKPLLEAGKDAGVISEAGCPGVADPGAEVVKHAHQKDIKVVPFAGPSAILLSLMASGFNGQQFAFHGYLPIDKRDRLQALRNLEKEMQQRNQTQIFMETPYRNNKLLEDLLTTLHPDTRLCIAANVTSPTQEFIQTKSIRQWQGKLPDIHKQPAVFLIYK